MEASWINDWGLWAVLLGALFEGEAVLIAAGYAVSQGYLPLAPTLAVSILGATLGDHAFYLVGRLGGPRLFGRFAALRRVRARATLLLRRWGRLTAFAARFAYGLRAVVPLTMGAARFPGSLFLPFNLLGAVVFASIYLTLGYFFGELVEELVGRIRGMHLWILLGIVASGMLLWVVREWRLFHPAEAPAEESEDDAGGA
jgi:membrane protein DedA with SNARE-associated domain